MTILLRFAFVFPSIRQAEVVRGTGQHRIAQYRTVPFSIPKETEKERAREEEEKDSQNVWHRSRSTGDKGEGDDL